MISARVGFSCCWLKMHFFLGPVTKTPPTPCVCLCMCVRELTLCIWLRLNKSGRRFQQAAELLSSHQITLKPLDSLIYGYNVTLKLRPLPVWILEKSPHGWSCCFSINTFLGSTVVTPNILAGAVMIDACQLMNSACGIFATLQYD